MSRNQFLILLLLVGVLGSAGVAMFSKGITQYQESGAKIGAKLLPNVNAADATEIRIKDAKAEVTLISKNGSWGVKERGGYPANIAEVSELLIKIVEAKVVQTETVGASLYPRIELIEPGKGEGSGTLLELKDKSGKQIARLIFGKTVLKKDPGNPLPNARNGVPAGRYVLAQGKANNVVVLGDPFANVEAKSGRFLAKQFFKIDRIKTITMAGSGDRKWKITRDEEYGQWKFAAGDGTLDPSAAGGAVNALGKIEFSDVSGSGKVEDGESPITITAETFDDLTYTVKIAKQKTGADYLVTILLSGVPPTARVPGKSEKPEEAKRLDKEFADSSMLLKARAEFEKILGQWTYIFAAKTLAPLMKDRTQLLAQAQKPNEERSPPQGMPPGFPFPR
jgi:hypothetical protein